MVLQDTLAFIASQDPDLDIEKASIIDLTDSDAKAVRAAVFDPTSFPSKAIEADDVIFPLSPIFKEVILKPRHWAMVHGYMCDWYHDEYTSAIAIFKRKE